MRWVESTGGGEHHFCTGFIAALSVSAVYLLVVELWPSAPSGTLLVWAGLMLLVGLLLMFPERTWPVGVGFLAGAAVSLAVMAVIGTVWIVQHTV
ncbi:hypothetical protein [Nocardioides antri]|uniref:Uncharacterized protein n=1 Tax=Nocardioides antri TaxID=2607659 RepID=A0A5B1LTL7_9ACTN|nr:hypothetical protein [Nocardioides antri]KAA1424022.1 hypothetical protein F0U47_20045 [Nocardioides antri]